MRILIAVFFVTFLTISCKSKKVVQDNSSTTMEQRRSGSGERGGERGERPGRPSVDEVFKMDINQDGMLSKNEVQGRLLKDFDRVDSNNDGFITKEEFQNMPKPERGQRPPRNQ